MRGLQSTEDIVISESGLGAVETEIKPVQELALTLPLPMVVLIVLDRLQKLEHVEKTFVQV